MRVFHSELVVNPEFYSFGYSVYASLEQGDDLGECYDRGFLPFVGVRDPDGLMLYMARGTRVRTLEFVERAYHHRAERRALEHFPDGLEVIEHERPHFDADEQFREFLLRYFKTRFGSAAMPREHLDAILRSPLLTHIVEYRSSGRPAAYMLETHGQTFSHVWYISYDPMYENTHLGAYLFIDFLRRARAAGRRYGYLGVTCGIHMRFKQNFQPLEYWDGLAWVPDAKDSSLSALLTTDATRSLALVDQWRETRGPYHPAPYRFDSVHNELRFLFHIFLAMPRVAAIIIIVISAAILSFVVAVARVLLA